MNTTLLNSIVNSESLPSMPAVAFKVLELCRQDDINLDDVARVIEKDPALTAKILKVANSSMFGMSKKVGGLDQAMVVLGLRTVKIMSLGFSLVDTFKEGTSTGFDYNVFWRRCMSTAVAARQIADMIGDVRRDEAFVGGLLCDIGMMAAERHPEGIYRPVIERYNKNGGRLQDIEEEILGVTHAKISGMMMAHWSMPEIVCHAVGAHHGEGIDEVSDRTRPLTNILWAASGIAELFTGDADPAEYEDVRGHILSIINLKADQLEGIMAELNDQVSEMADMFSVEMNRAISFEEIRTGAMMQIATLSMSAEEERKRALSEMEQATSQIESLRSRAEIDKLTGIANRQTFDDRLAGAIDNAATNCGELGLILLDVDHFKKFNDTYGHLTGDEVLRAVGKCLHEVNEETRFAARYGGEEFAVIVADATARELRVLAEEIRTRVAGLRVAHGTRELQVTASFGAAHVSFDEQAVDALEIISRADACLYEAKREGRNRVEITF